MKAQIRMIIVYTTIILSFVLLFSAYAEAREVGVSDKIIDFKDARIYYFEGDAMEPTIKDGDALAVVQREKIEINRNDILVCHYPYSSDMMFISRCVAVPGDAVYRKNGVTHILDIESNEDIPLDGRYEMYFPNGSQDDYEYYFLHENEYFIVGDNRYNSHDSRDWMDSNNNRDIGPISKEMIVGVVAGKINHIMVSEIEPFGGI